MFEFTESVFVNAGPAASWDRLRDVESWWLPSNPEHIELDIRPPGSRVEEGVELRIRERIAGIEGEAIGRVTELVEQDHVTWVSPHARHRFFGLPLTVAEGVRWDVAPAAGGTKISATVWADFRRSPWGRLAEWLFKGPLRGVEKDRRHAAVELAYLKQLVEKG